MVYSEKKLTPESQQAFEELYRAGLFHKLNERRDAAYELFERAARINPDAPEVLYELAKAHYGMQSLFDSTETVLGDSLLTRAIELDPDNVFYKEEMAEYLIIRKDYSAALPLCEELARTKPFNAEKTERLAMVYEMTGKYEKALNTIAELEEMEGDDEKYAENRLKIYVRSDDSLRAYSLLEELMRRHPEDLSFAAQMVHISLFYRNFARAEETLNSRLAQYPDDPHLYLAQVELYTAQGKDELVTQTLRKMAVNNNSTEEDRFDALEQLLSMAKTSADSLSLFPLFHETIKAPTETSMLARFGAYIGMTQHLPLDSLVDLFEKINETEPSFELPWRYRVSYYYENGDMDTAMKLLREALKANPEELKLIILEASILDENGNGRGALEALRRGDGICDEEEDVETLVEYLLYYADILYDNGYYDDAIGKYEHALEKDTTSILVMNNYAYFLSRIERNLEYAEQMSRKVIESEPESEAYLDTYAWVLYKLGRFDEARDYMEKALAGDPSELGATYYDHAGDIYCSCGDMKQARFYWKLALKSSPDDETKKSVQKKLKSKKR